MFTASMSQRTHRKRAAMKWAAFVAALATSAALSLAARPVVDVFPDGPDAVVMGVLLVGTPLLAAWVAWMVTSSQPWTAAAGALLGATGAIAWVVMGRDSEEVGRIGALFEGAVTGFVPGLVGVVIFLVLATRQRAAPR